MILSDIDYLAKRLFSRALVGLAIALVVLTGQLWAAEEADNELVEMVVNLLDDKDKDVRAVGLEHVRTEVKGAAATKLFAERLPKLPAAAQIGLLSALADRGDAAARPAVIDIFKTNRDEPVRVAAIAALGPLGQVEDVRLLAPLVVSLSKAEKAAARGSLVRLSGDAVAATISAEMNQAQPPIRVTLIEVLATRRALSAVPDLLSAAIDADPSVRAAAMTALGQLADRQHVPGMVQGVLKAKKGPERDAAERAVATVCGRIADVDGRAEHLLAAMQNLNDADRLAVLPTLGRVGGPAALQVIEAAIADADADKHESGLRALCNWPDASIAPRLIELAKGDQHPEHRPIAQAALIRIAPLPDKRSDSERLDLLKTVIAMCSRDEDRNLVIKRARAVRTLETLNFLLPYMDQPQFAQQACESIVELAHHRELREPNKSEFYPALDKVIQTSKDSVVVERANRYKNNQTWARPTVAPQP